MLYVLCACVVYVVCCVLCACIVRVSCTCVVCVVCVCCVYCVHVFYLCCIRVVCVRARGLVGVFWHRGFVSIFLADIHHHNYQHNIWMSLRYPCS